MRVRVGETVSINIYIYNGFNIYFVLWPLARPLLLRSCNRWHIVVVGVVAIDIAYIQTIVYKTKHKTNVKSRYLFYGYYL